jgi:Cathepsin propeptide inhibitor domain (I29)
MKLVVAVLLLWQQSVAAFVPVHNQFARRQLLATLGLGVDKTDVSIPYDAAARLAYDQWRVDFNKGDFDPVRFKIFKDNYEIVTVANVKAKKKAREEGTVSLSLMSLNEFGDWTQEEYFRAQQQDDDPSIGAPQPTTTSDILGKAVEAVELQTEASNALEEAVDALALEEQVRFGCSLFLCSLVADALACSIIH